MIQVPTLKRLSSQRSAHPPGVYFGLDFREYLDDPSLSASGIKDLRVSPLTYWANSPMNPDRERSQSTAMFEGTAYHKRILEGKEAFDAAYGPKIDPDDYPEALKSGEQLRAACGALGLKKSGTLAEMSAAVRAADPRAVLWTEIEAEHMSQHAGKELLAPKMLARIEQAAKAVEASPTTRALFRGGHAEVSIFWVDEETGIPLKARLDYLSQAAVADLKTFSNTYNKPIREAVSYAMASNSYGIQAVHYLAAIRSTNGLRANDRFVFVFVENAPAPNVLAREFARDRLYFDLVQEEYRDALRFYRECLDRWGTGRPWVSAAEVEAFTDEDFPVWSYR